MKRKANKKIVKAVDEIQKIYDIIYEIKDKDEQRIISNLFQDLSDKLLDNVQGGSMNWSEKYYEGLNEEQHTINNEWFKKMLSCLNDTGTLIVPNLNKSFNKQGEEV